MTATDEDPTYAVLIAWERLGAIVRTLSDAASSQEGWEPGRNRTPVALARELSRHEVVNPSYVDALQSLAELRNNAAHGAVRIDREAAAAFVAAANELFRATDVIIDFRYGG